MTDIPIRIAVEDLLSEAVVRRLLQNASKAYACGSAYSRGGFGYLKQRSSGFNQAARHVPFLVLTDLDQAPCPPALIKSWFGSIPRHRNFIFSVAVREVEAWLLADSAAFLQFAQVGTCRIPQDVDTIPDPKRLLIQVVSRSADRDIRSDILPRSGSTAREGPNYNGRLTEFVYRHWQPRRCAMRSASLARIIRVLDNFVPHGAT